MASRYRTVRPFETNSCTGERSHFVMEDGADEITIVTEQDLEPILQKAKDSRNRRDEGWKGELHHVAFMPNPIMEKLRREGKLHDQKELTKWLNHPDNKIFRSKEGHV
jgi:hypothetical protein